jgi:acetyl-CoA carboxylase carboxyltransferase component
MATAVVPKLVLTVNHASGAGYYAMAGQGFDPDFILSLPTGRMAVMEGESAVKAVFGDKVSDAEFANRVEKMRIGYEHQLDAKHAGAMGHVDTIVTPEDTRKMLSFALDVVTNYEGPHIGPFVLPPLDYTSA